MTTAPDSSMPDDTIEGVVDGLSGAVIRGWACSRHATAATIEVEHDGSCLGSTRADQYRADLAAAGKRDGNCAFSITLTSPPPPGSRLRVMATLGGNSCELTGSPLLVANVPVQSKTDVLPLPLATPELHGSLDQCGGAGIRGWLRRRDGRSAAPAVSLYEGEHELARFEPNQWRPDLADLFRDDGCSGFDLRLPEALCDGELHELQLRLADSRVNLLGAPFRIRVAAARAGGVASESRWPAPLQRRPSSRQLTLSVIVNFYNMRREAERTLTSLSRDYQRGAADLNYEVLCIDNGSSPPLDPAWIESFGPQFRLLRPSRQLSSPCAALNEAALEARGEYLAVMIDGAHLLTPGVFEQALQAWREDAAAVVVLRHWFIGGDQRWLAMAGYTRAQEDLLFERIRWPQQGYELFRIGAPIGENPEPWFDGLSESNCLMLPTMLYDRLGGIDEAFDQAGGGFANLDLWKRASQLADGALVSLIGEASFHQFHDGTTTNVQDAEKDLRVRAYANAYRRLRGEEYAGVHRSRLQYRGGMPSEFATGVRQRTLLPMRLGVTDTVRPGRLALHFDDGALAHLQSVYAECALHREVCWLGHSTGVAPADLVSLHEIIHQLRPDAIVASGVEPGLIGFLNHMLQAVGCADARLLHLAASVPATEAGPRVTRLAGSSDNPDSLVTVRHWVGSAEIVLVLHGTRPAEGFSLASLQACGELVSYRSWLVCLGTLFGQPWLGYSHHDHLQTIRDFVRGDSRFVIDRSWNRQLISTGPSGYLRKVGGMRTAANYDSTLDIFAPAQPALPEYPQ